MCVRARARVCAVQFAARVVTTKPLSAEGLLTGGGGGGFGGKLVGCPGARARATASYARAACAAVSNTPSRSFRRRPSATAAAGSGEAGSDGAGASRTWTDQRPSGPRSTPRYRPTGGRTRAPPAAPADQTLARYSAPASASSCGPQCTAASTWSAQPPRSEAAAGYNPQGGAWSVPKGPQARPKPWTWYPHQPFPSWRLSDVNASGGNKNCRTETGCTD
jgi:hypothetical protein